MKILIIFLIPFLVYSQEDEIWTRNFRRYLNENDELIGVKVGHPDVEKIWAIRDIFIMEEISNLLDKKTQEGMEGVGVIISPLTDKGLFNWSAANKVCPQGWRLPTIGEWDTLTQSLTTEQLTYMFPQSKGFIGYSMKLKDSTIVKEVQNLRGGFWWSSTKIGERLTGYEWDDNYVWRPGYLLEGDCAAVRCIKNEEE